MKTRGSGREHLSHAGNPVLEDSFDAGGHRRLRDRAPAAGTNQLKVDRTADDAFEDQIATISLECRPDVLEHALELGTVDLRCTVFRATDDRPDLDDASFDGVIHGAPLLTEGYLDYVAF